MSLRIQKQWEQLGRPQTPGEHPVPGLGTLLVSEPNLTQIGEAGANPVVVLAHHPESGFVAKWEIVEVRPA